MRTIIDTIKFGTAKERLAVLSDIVSILGVSLASVLAGTLALGGTLQNLLFSNLVFAVLVTIAALSAAAGAVALYLILAAKISKPFDAPAGVRPLLLAAFHGIGLCLLLIAAFGYYEFIASIRITK